MGKGRALGNRFSVFKINTQRLLQFPGESFQELCPGGHVSETALRNKVREHSMAAGERKGWQIPLPALHWGTQPSSSRNFAPSVVAFLIEDLNSEIAARKGSVMVLQNLAASLAGRAR